MSISRLPLAYCTNVHPAQSAQAVLAGLQRYAVPIQNRLGRPIAVGLWFAWPVVQELHSHAKLLEDWLAEFRRLALPCYTLNAFPYGNFHADIVKEQVYLPDWSTPERLEYTRSCAKILAQLLDPGVEGSISTLPLGFKQSARAADFQAASIQKLIECAQALDKIAHDLGRMIRLAIEPEPLCILETTAEAIAFFQQLWLAAEQAGSEDLVHKHIGLCYDICHQAVEFENISDSILAIDRAGIRINKVHISCAIEVLSPGQNPASLRELHRYVEPRYLHQTFAYHADGRITSVRDLSQEFLENSQSEFHQANTWRVHYHVPVDAERLGALGTTRQSIREALSAIAKLSYAPHLEVETYTWEVLPNQQIDLVTGMARELSATYELLKDMLSGSNNNFGNTR